MAFNIKKYIIENNNRQNILTEAGSISGHEKLLMQIFSLINKFPITQTQRDAIFGILRKGLKNPWTRELHK